MKKRIIGTILSAFMIASCICLSIHADAESVQEESSAEIVKNLTATVWAGTNSVDRYLMMEFHSDGSGVASTTYQDDTETAVFRWVLSGKRIIVQAERVEYLEYNDENGNPSLLLLNESGEIELILTQFTTDDEVTAVQENNKETETETETETEELLSHRPEFDVSDYLVIKDEDYLNMTVRVAPAQQVTDEEIDADIADSFYYLEEYDDLIVKKTEGTVENGDTVNIDYVGTKDGVTFDGGTAEGYDLVIGSGSFIDGFEEGLIGKEIGSTVDLNLTFPEEYGAEELSGEDVVFTVTINYVTEIPEITDEIAEILSDGEYTTAEEYRESVRASLQSGYDEAYQNSVSTAVMEKLTQMYPIEEYPQENIDYNVQLIVSQYFEPFAAMYGMSVEEFAEAMYGMSFDEVKEQELIPSASQTVEQEIILGAIAKKEGITMTEEELRERLQGYADLYEVEIEDITNGQDMEDLRIKELNQKVIDWLKDRITVEDC